MPRNLDFHTNYEVPLPYDISNEDTDVWGDVLNSTFELIDDDIVLRDSFANRPSADVEGRIFLDTDDLIYYYDEGNQWTQIGSQMAVFDDNSVVKNSPTEINFADGVTASDSGSNTIDVDFAAVDVDGFGLEADGSNNLAFDESVSPTWTSEHTFSGGITGLPAPSANSDAARKEYVDSVASGLALKEPVVAATDGSNVDLSSSTDPNPIDGVTLSNGDRVLLKDQTDGTENGIYVAQTATDPTTWVRADDMDEDSEAISGAFTFVQNGSNNNNEGWVVSTSDPITLGSTAITFVQFSGAGQIVAGNQLSKNGDTLDVVEGSGSGLDADTVDGFQAADLRGDKQLFQATSTDTSTNINQTSWTSIEWDSEFIKDNAYTHDASTSPESITFDEAGRYRIIASLSYDTNGNADVNPGIKFAVNGSRKNTFGLTGYGSSSNGHNEASNTVHRVVDVAAGDTLKVQTIQQAGSGTVTLRASESYLDIENLSESVQLSSDADTLDGKDSSEFVQTNGNNPLTGTQQFDVLKTDDADGDGNAFYVQEDGTSGNLIVDSDNTADAFQFTDTGSLGIGTAPSYTLDVNGIANFQSDVNVTGLASFSSNIQLATGQAIEDGGGTDRFELNSSSSIINDNNGTRALRLDGNTGNDIFANGNQPFRIRDDEQGGGVALQYTTSASFPGTLTLDANTFVKDGAGLVVGDTVKETTGDMGGTQQIKGRTTNDVGYEAVSYNGTNSNIAGNITFARTRTDTVGSTGTAVQQDDRLGGISFKGDDGGSDDAWNYSSSALLVDVDGAVSDGVIPTRMEFYTETTGGSITEALRIDSNQRLDMRGNKIISSTNNIVVLDEPEVGIEDAGRYALGNGTVAYGEDQQGFGNSTAVVEGFGGFAFYDRDGLFTGFQYKGSSSAPGTLELTNASLNMSSHSISNVSSITLPQDSEDIVQLGSSGMISVNKVSVSGGATTALINGLGGNASSLLCVTMPSTNKDILLAQSSGVISELESDTLSTYTWGTSQGAADFNIYYSNGDVKIENTTGENHDFEVVQFGVGR